MGVHECDRCDRWELDGSDYRVWKLDSPSFKASGSSLNEALDRLYSMYLELGGAGVVFELTPLPDAFSAYEAVRYAGLGYNEGVTVLNDPRDLFQHGVC